MNRTAPPLLSPPSSQHGFGLIAALAIVVSIGALGASLSYMYQSSTRSTAETASGASALAVAKAGMQRAKIDVVSNCPPADVSATDANGGQYTISYAADQHEQNRYWITATGYVPNQAHAEWQRTVRQSFDCDPDTSSGNLFVGDNATAWNHINLITNGTLVLTGRERGQSNDSDDDQENGNRSGDRNGNGHHDNGQDEHNDNGHHYGQGEGNDHHDNQGNGNGHNDNDQGNDHGRRHRDNQGDGNHGNDHRRGLGWDNWGDHLRWSDFGEWNGWQWLGWQHWRGWRGCDNNVCIQSNDDFALTETQDEENPQDVHFRASYSTTDGDQLSLYLNITLDDHAGNIFCGNNGNGVRLDTAADNITCTLVSYSPGWHEGGDSDGDGCRRRGQGHHDNGNHDGQHNGNNGHHYGNENDDNHHGDGNHERRTADRGHDGDNEGNGNGNGDQGNHYGQNGDHGDCQNGRDNDHDCGNHQRNGNEGDDSDRRNRYVISVAEGGVVDPVNGTIDLNLGNTFSPDQIGRVRLRAIGLWDDDDDDTNPESLTVNDACIAIQCPPGGGGHTRDNWQEAY